jgi:epoxyqueuosine reductase
MHYMDREPERRSQPVKVLPSVRSVISLVINYYHPDDPRPLNRPAGRVAKYAYGVDYHKIIEKKLKKLARFIVETGGPGTEVKIYVDTGPLLEKAFARESGLGFFGKNTNIITKRFGSWVFLASILTNLELERDTPHTGACGSCRICIDHCPTDALLGDYRMDATRCISYLTIESKSPVPDEIKSRVGEWMFGCDICQEVCPYNYKAQVTRHTELYPEKRAGSWIELEAIERMQKDEEVGEMFKQSPVKRAKREGLLKNAQVVRENLSR